MLQCYSGEYENGLFNFKNPICPSNFGDTKPLPWSSLSEELYLFPILKYTWEDREHGLFYLENGLSPMITASTLHKSELASSSTVAFSKWDLI